MDSIFDRWQIPEHTRETIVNYLIKGWAPGGFVTSMLAMDMERALYNADPVNGSKMQSIGRWIIERCPQQAWGSYEAVEMWAADVGGRRTMFTEQVEKQKMWDILQGGSQGPEW